MGGQTVCLYGPRKGLCRCELRILDEKGWNVCLFSYGVNVKGAGGYLNIEKTFFLLYSNEICDSSRKLNGKKGRLERNGVILLPGYIRVSMFITSS